MAHMAHMARMFSSNHCSDPHQVYRCDILDKLDAKISSHLHANMLGGLRNGHQLGSDQYEDHSQDRVQ